MKKIMIMLAVVAMACVANAASLNWLMQNILGPENAAITSVNQLYVELYYLPTAMGTTAGWTDTFADGTSGALARGGRVDLVQPTPPALEGGNVAAGTGQTGNGIWTHLTAPDGMIGWMTVYAKVYYVADPVADGAASALNYDYIGYTHYFNVNATSLASTAIVIEMALTSSGGHLKYIPEPATGLLALAGIGLLIAQKRKRA